MNSKIFPFNRTLVELKLIDFNSFEIFGISFNRTLVELKHNAYGKRAT